MSNPEVSTEDVYANPTALVPIGTQPVYAYTDRDVQVRLAKTQQSSLPNQYSVMILKDGVNVFQGYCYLP